MIKFYCEECNSAFEADGEKLSWHDPIYGASWKLVANCHSCGNQAGEMKKRMKTSSNDSQSCTTGACPFVSN